MITRNYKIHSDVSLKILFISDLHKKKLDNNSEIFINLKKFHPDLVFFVGDMISRSSTDLSSIEKLCKAVKGKFKTYACFGNHEQSAPEEVYNDLCEMYKRYGVKLLDNEHESLYINEKKINIYGLTLPYSTYRNEKNGFSNLYIPKICDIKNLLGDPVEGFNILLAHSPIFFDLYSKWNVDLILSGHVHGGIIRLPFIGGILSPERRFLPKYTLGIYKKNDTKMVVSAGIGKFRLFNPPEIVKITVEKE